MKRTRTIWRAVTTLGFQVLSSAIILAWSATSAAAATVTVTWDPNPEPDIAGYIVFYGTSSGQYAASIDVGNQTSFQFVEPDPANRYYLAIRAYNESGLQSEFSPEVSTPDPLLTLALSGITSNVRAPQPLGASVTFAATTAGGLAPLQYKWFIFDGSTWQTSQHWSTSHTFTWRPAAAKPNYQVRVWARSATSTADAPESPSSSSSVAFPIVPPLALTSLTANLRSPQPAGTSITVTSSATGGVAPHQFKWLIFNGKSWSVARNWSANSKFTWTPDTANTNYKVMVWARSATSTVDAAESANGGSSIPYAITAGVVVTRLKADKSAPQLAGSKILFTAAASGAKSYKYKWWVFNGVKWATAKEWSSSNKFTWKPSAANAKYQVLVRVRDGSNPSRSSAGKSIPFSIKRKR